MKIANFEHNMESEIDEDKSNQVDPSYIRRTRGSLPRAEKRRTVSWSGRGCPGKGREQSPQRGIVHRSLVFIHSSVPSVDAVNMIVSDHISSAAAAAVQTVPSPPDVYANNEAHRLFQCVGFLSAYNVGDAWRPSVRHLRASDGLYGVVFKAI